MRLARVLGSVVATIKHPTYEGRTILLCQPLAPDLSKFGTQVIAVDTVQAGAGDLVLLLTEGNGVRQILGKDSGPIRTIIAGIVDTVTLDDAIGAEA